MRAANPTKNNIEPINFLILTCCAVELTGLSLALCVQPLTYHKINEVAKGEGCIMLTFHFSTGTS